MDRDYTLLSDDELMTDIGEKLKEFRTKKGLSQKEASQKAGVSRSTLVRLEQGKGATLRTFLHLLRIYDRLNVLQSVLSPPEVSREDILNQLTDNQGNEAIDGGTW
ncbi:MAG: helix-turn-helix domain-containing protein [bacterium]